MKSLFVLFLFFFVFSFHMGNAQEFHFESPIEQICPYDSSITLLQFENWEIYQTDNDQWDGQKIEACYEVSNKAVWGPYYLDISNIDTDKSIFMRSKLAPTNNSSPLKPNWVYSVNAGGYGANDATYSFDQNCENGICSGIILGIEIPTEDIQSKTQRVHKLQFDNYFELNACMPTEYFEDQRINDAIIKLTIDSLHNNSDSLRIPVTSIYSQEIWDNIIAFDSIGINCEIDENGAYHINILEALNSYYGAWNLGLHDANLYPKTENTTKIEVNLVENNNVKSDLFIYVDEYQNLSFQAFTELIGGLIDGSDSIRHNFTLVQEGGSMCVTWVEVLFGKNTSFRYKSGDIHLSSQSACLKFLEGSKLIVDQTEMIYGDDNGAGMMALSAGSEIRMIGKSSLEFNNTLAILAPNNEGQAYVDIYLERGQMLSFTKTGHVISFGNPIIRLHMLGGEVDLSELDEKERSKFIFIYPEPNEDINKNISVFPNPVKDRLNYSFIGTEEQSGNWTITDISGRKVVSGEQLLSKGLNDYSIEGIKQLVPGIYFFQIKIKNGTAIKTITKL